MILDIKNPDDVQHPFGVVSIKFTGRGHKVSADDALDALFDSGSESIKIKGKIGDRFIKNRKGVYAFVSTSCPKEILYIGKAKNIRNRVLQHHSNNFRVLKKMIDNDEFNHEVYAWYVDDNSKVEDELIKKYKPKYNTVGKIKNI